MTAISFQKNCGSANLRQEHDAICDWVFDKEPDFKAFEEGTTKLDRADMEKAKDLFYDIFGWDKTTGVPTRETLEKFDLGDMADDLRPDSRRRDCCQRGRSPVIHRNERNYHAVWQTQTRLYHHGGRRLRP